MTILLWNLAFFFAVGAILGATHFRALAWNVRLLTGGASMPLAMSASLLRLAMTAGGLVVVAFYGAGALLASMLGFLALRALVLHRSRI